MSVTPFNGSGKPTQWVGGAKTPHRRRTRPSSPFAASSGALSGRSSPPPARGSLEMAAACDLLGELETPCSVAAASEKWLRLLDAENVGR